MLLLLLSLTLAAAQDTPAPTAPDAPAAPASPPLAIPVDAPPAATPPAEPSPELISYSPTVLFPIRAVNLGPTEVRAAEVMFRRRYEAATGQSLADEARVQSAIVASDDQGLHAACLTLTCTRWITIDLVRLDTEVFVTAIERDGTAAITQRVELVANGIDALPLTFDRIARALAGRVPIERIPASRGVPSAQPTTAATPAAAPTSGTAPAPAGGSRVPPAPHRPGVVNVSGFKFGVLGPIFPGFGASLTHAFNWRRESARSFFELTGGFTAPLALTTNPNARTFAMIFAEVGVSHVFPSKSGTALYAGGGLGPRIGGYDDSGFGGGVYGQAGILFGRLTSSRVYLQAKVGGDVFTGWTEPYVVSYAGLETGVGF